MSQHEPVRIARLTWAVSISVCLLIICLTLGLAYLDSQRFQQTLKAEVISELGQVRAGLETGINDNVYLTRGLTAFITAYPHLDPSIFHTIADEILRNPNFIINIGIAPGNILSFVHPLEGNENALGLNYEQNSQQWPIVKKAIDSRKTIIAGPVELVQGGRAFICRTPIFIPAPDPKQEPVYWGLASIVIDQQKILDRAGFSHADRNLRMALRGTDGRGEQGGFIAGEEEVFNATPLTMDVVIPGGSWQLAGIPLQGWQQPSPNQRWILFFGGVLALAGGILVFLWQHHESLIKNQTRLALERAEKYSAELNENKNFLDAILENIPNIIFVKEAKELKFVLFNKAGEAITGIPRQQLIGKSDFDLFQPEEADRFTSIDREVLASRTLVEIPEESLQTRHLGKRIMHTRKIPLLDKEGEPTHLIGISEDITELKQAAREKQHLEKQLQQAQKMEAIGLMAGGVAHDLNNILAAITGYPELILKKLPEHSELHKPLRIVRDAGRRAAAVVADLLTVAKGAASTRVPVNLNDLVEEYLDSPEFGKLQKTYPEIAIRLDLDRSLDIISASPVHIKKILMNLVNNAVEAIDGAGTIGIATTNVPGNGKDAPAPTPATGDHVLLQITDTGTGIARDDLDHIFEPFYTKKALGRSGTGLGLAVVWNTVQDHNGRIQVDSTPQGSSFRLYFPVADAEQIFAEDHETMPEATGNGEHILVVDDEPHMRDIACRMLEASGYRATAVSSGEQAVDYLRTNRPDLLVIDMLMPPGLNGRQTYAEIVKLNPGQKAVIVSGFSESDDVRETLSLGAHSFMYKPYTQEQLARAVKDALAG